MGRAEHGRLGPGSAYDEVQLLSRLPEQITVLAQRYVLRIAHDAADAVLLLETLGLAVPVGVRSP